MVLRDGSPCRYGQVLRPDSSDIVTAVNVNDLTPAADLLHGDEEVVYGDDGN